MEQPDVQQIFFQHIRNNLPPHLSLVDEIAELLNISTDSAYRRIRGEKGISFDEVRILCSHFKISLDQLFHLNTDSIIFTGRSADLSQYSFDLYLRNSILGQLEFMNSFEKKEVMVLNKDVPMFHYYNFPKLAAFKFFFWMKTILQYPLFGKSIFAADEFTQGLQDTARKIVMEYTRINSQEIWNVENINATLNQIEYYRDTRVFASNDDVRDLYDALNKTIDHIEKQGEMGYKFDINGKPTVHGGTYKLFVNDFILGDNTYLAILNDTRVAYLNHSVLNVVWTKDTLFTEHMYQHFQNIIRRSTLISDVGERERSRFFNSIRERIDARWKTL